ncbi:MAG: DoxX family protein [Bacteroidota bacterium]
MKQIILKSNNDWTGLILRLSIALVLLPHGVQKMLGLFGGYGFTGTMGFFTETMQLPWLIGFMVILIEFVTPFLLVVGLLSRIWALAVTMLMLGIIFTSHLDNGFFMNWYGSQKGEGIEYHLLMIGLSIALLFNGSGRYSLDNKLATV